MRDKRILVIDDVKNVRETIRLTLGMEGYTIFEASNLVEAETCVEQNHLDLIITDMIMPEQDGSQLFDILEKLEIVTPVLAVSGGGAGVSAQLALSVAEVKAHGTLKKPFTACEIKGAVSNILS